MGELLTGRDHDDLAVFIRQINLAVSRNGRRAEAAADHGQALSIQFLACLQVVSVERAVVREHVEDAVVDERRRHVRTATGAAPEDRKSTRLNSSHSQISYAVFCLKKKKKKKRTS